jgi:hypothetical protein
MTRPGDRHRSEIHPPQDPRAFLVLTGHQEKGKHVVLVKDDKVLIPGIRFQALVDLVVALKTSHTGHSRIPSAGNDPNRTRLIIHRLRGDLGQALGRRRAKQLIQTVGARTTYFLDLESRQAAVADSFFELTGDCVAAEIIKILQKFVK